MKVIPLILCAVLLVSAQQQQQYTPTYQAPQKQWDCQCKLIPPPAEVKAEADKRLEALNSKAMTVYRDARGTVLSMSDILFETGKAALKQEAKDNLTEVAAILKTLLSESHVEIEGHTDSIGNAAANEKLSDQRANAVLTHIVSRNVDASRLKAKGYGSARPVAPNSTVEGRAKNRRVELVIEDIALPPQEPLVIPEPVAAPAPTQFAIAPAQPVQQQAQPVQPTTQQQPVQQAQPVQPVAQQVADTTQKTGGLLARINLNDFTTGKSSGDKNLSMGFGFGVGYTKTFPFSKFGSSLPMSINPEFLFYYRTIYNESYEYYNDEDIEISVTEFAISIPIMVRYMFTGDKKIHVAAGIQFDIPFSTEREATFDGDSESEKVKDRNSLDIGLPLGIGYRINENIEADFRIVLGMSSLTGKSKDKSSFNQYGIGVTYWGF